MAAVSHAGGSLPGFIDRLIYSNDVGSGSKKNHEPKLIAQSINEMLFYFGHGERTTEHRVVLQRGLLLPALLFIRKRGAKVIKRWGDQPQIDMPLVVRVVLLEVGNKSACVSVESLEEFARQIEQCLRDQAGVGDDLHVVL